MSINNDKESETQIDSEFSKLITINHDNCFQPYIKSWCKECVPSCVIEGWTSGNSEIDNFIKDTIYNAKNYLYNNIYYPIFLEWVPFDKFEDIKESGEGGFAKVYSATWIDGKTKYKINWKKAEPIPIKVALKRLYGSQNLSAEYLSEVCTAVLTFHILINV